MVALMIVSSVIWLSILTSYIVIPLCFIVYCLNRGQGRHESELELSVPLVAESEINLQPVRKYRLGSPYWSGGTQRCHGDGECCYGKAFVHITYICIMLLGILTTRSQCC